VPAQLDVRLLTLHAVEEPTVADPVFDPDDPVKNATATPAPASTATTPTAATRRVFVNLPSMKRCLLV
jgi:hypothetical protein